MMSKPTNADSKVIWMDGKLVAYEDATVHVLSHSLHYGGAAFEGIRAYETGDGKAAIFRLEDHMRRFLDSMKALGYSSPYTLMDYTRAVVETVKANDFKECYIRPLAYMDDTTRGLKLPNDPKALSMIAVWKWGKYMGDEGQRNGIRVTISTYRRPDISTSLTWAKCSGNYLISMLARREASKSNFDEAILLDPNGFVAEGSGENIFTVKDGVIYTPPTGFILPGITRNSVMKFAQDLGYTVKEENITRNQLYIADECFFTGTAVEVTPIREIDCRTVGNGEVGPVSKKMMDLYFRTVRNETPEYKKWLTVV